MLLAPRTNNKSPTDPKAWCPRVVAQFNALFICACSSSTLDGSGRLVSHDLDLQVCKAQAHLQTRVSFAFAFAFAFVRKVTTNQVLTELGLGGGTFEVSGFGTVKSSLQEQSAAAEDMRIDPQFRR
jgi:hypothetical protein